jgi:hypothetical protein
LNGSSNLIFEILPSRFGYELLLGCVFSSKRRPECRRQITDHGLRITRKRAVLALALTRKRFALELFLTLITLSRLVCVLFRFNPPIQLSRSVVDYVDGRPH